MNPALQSAIDEEAKKFALALAARIGEVMAAQFTGLAVGAPAKRGPGRPPKSASAAPKKASGKRKRRSPEEIEADIGKILGVLQGRTAGLRSEELRIATGIDKKYIGKTLEDALKANRIVKTGEKRATTYYTPENKPGVGKGILFQEPELAAEVAAPDKRKKKKVAASKKKRAA